jgi:hypothetical protein
VLIDNPPWQTGERSQLHDSDHAQAKREAAAPAVGAAGYAAFFEPAQQSRASSALPPRDKVEAPHAPSQELPACAPGPAQAVEPAAKHSAPELVQILDTAPKPAAQHPHQKRYLSPLPPNPY